MIVRNHCSNITKWSILDVLNVVKLASVPAREDEVREQIPHTWASSNDNFLKSNFSAWFSYGAIFGEAPDWPVVMT